MQFCMPVPQFTLKGKHRHGEEVNGHLQFDETACGKETVLLKNVEAYTHRTVICFQVERRQHRA